MNHFTPFIDAERGTGFADGMIAGAGIASLFFAGAVAAFLLLVA